MYMVNEKGDECAKVHEGLPMPQKDKLGKACIDMEKIHSVRIRTQNRNGKQRPQARNKEENKSNN